MREFTLAFALGMLIFFCVTSWYPITYVHVVMSMVSGVFLFGMLRAWDVILRMMEDKNEP